MGKRRTNSKSLGSRVGTKRSDTRWLAPDGSIWDSRYEYVVWLAYVAADRKIRRTSKSDSFSFTLPIRSASCDACGSTEVGQRRTYTPDFYVDSEDTERSTVGYYIESKGYLRPKQRALLRSFYKAHPNAPVRFLLQRNYPATKTSSIVQWFNKFLKTAKVAVWNGSIPEGW